MTNMMNVKKQWQRLGAALAFEMVDDNVSSPSELSDEKKAYYVERIDDIDNETPWQEFEPKWWLRMMEVRQMMVEPKNFIPMPTLTGGEDATDMTVQLFNERRFPKRDDRGTYVEYAYAPFRNGVLVKKCYVISLNGVGWVSARPAAKIEVGDRLMWNGGGVYEVTEIRKKSTSYIFIREKSVSGQVSPRKLELGRLVALAKPYENHIIHSFR